MNFIYFINSIPVVLFIDLNSKKLYCHSVVECDNNEIFIAITQWLKAFQIICQNYTVNFHPKLFLMFQLTTRQYASLIILEVKVLETSWLLKVFVTHSSYLLAHFLGGIPIKYFYKVLCILPYIKSGLETLKYHLYLC